MEKKNYGTVILVAILFFIIGGVSTYFIMNNSNDNEPVVDDNQEDNSDSNSSVKYEDWMDYVMNSQIKSIELTYCDDNELVDDVPVSKTIQITKNDLKRVFDEVKKGEITKHYGGGFGSGCNYGFNIDYKKNNIEYDLDIGYYNLISNNFEDKNLLSIIEKEDFKVTETPIDDYEYNESDATFIFTYNHAIIDTIIDEYTK